MILFARRDRRRRFSVVSLSFSLFICLSLDFAPFFFASRGKLDYRIWTRGVEGGITPFVLRRCIRETINIEGPREWSDIIEEGKIEGWEISRRGDWRVEVLLRNENWEISRD